MVPCKLEDGNLVKLESDEEIAEEEAVCKVCFDVFKDEIALKTECGCKNALIHEECAANWSSVHGNNRCDFCGQEVQKTAVTLLRGSRDNRQKHKKRKWVFRFAR